MAPQAVGTIRAVQRKPESFDRRTDLKTLIAAAVQISTRNKRATEGKHLVLQLMCVAAVCLRMKPS